MRRALAKVSVADVLSHRTGVPANDLLWLYRAPETDYLLRAVGELGLALGADRPRLGCRTLRAGLLRLHKIVETAHAASGVNPSSIRARNNFLRFVMKQ